MGKWVTEAISSLVPFNSFVATTSKEEHVLYLGYICNLG